jgi:hypothetical protein
MELRIRAGKFHGRPWITRKVPAGGSDLCGFAPTSPAAEWAFGNALIGPVLGPLIAVYVASASGHLGLLDQVLALGGFPFPYPARSYILRKVTCKMSRFSGNLEPLLRIASEQDGSLRWE